jgi:flagellar FliJ protein
MARFAFKLEPVLRHRKMVEEQHQRELARLAGQLRQLQEELKALDAQAKAVADDVRSHHASGPLNMEFLMSHRRYVAAMQDRALRLVQRMSVLQRQIDEARVALVEASKRRKSIEKLKERQHQRWLDDQSLRQVKELDEIGMQLAYRRAGDESTGLTG